jgi:hypothetical protein
VNGFSHQVRHILRVALPEIPPRRIFRPEARRSSRRHRSRCSLRGSSVLSQKSGAETEGPKLGRLPVPGVRVRVRVLGT